METTLDDKLRKVVGIGPSDSTTIPIGNCDLPGKLTVAKSSPKPLNEVLSWHKTDRDPMLSN